MKLTKKGVARFIEQVLPLMLGLVCLLVMTLDSTQATDPVPLKLDFVGEYSFDEGATWQPLTEDADLTPKNGPLLLRGGFAQEVPPWSLHVYYYRDHIGVRVQMGQDLLSMTVHMQLPQLPASIQKQFPDFCGAEWRSFPLDGARLPGEPLMIRLENMHGSFNRDCYRNFLDSLYLGSQDREPIMDLFSPFTVLWNGAALLFFVAAAMFLGAAVAALPLRAGSTGRLTRLGLFALFCAGYLLLDNISLSAWCGPLVFNTYALQLCVFFAVHWLILLFRDCLTGRRLQLARVITVLSCALDILLILPSFLGFWAIYDTTPLWVCAQFLFAIPLILAGLLELFRGEDPDQPGICAGLLLLLSLLADLLGLNRGLTTNGSFTKVALLLVFLLYAIRMVQKLFSDHLRARQAQQLAQELEDNRTALMLSQLQPHFLYNILNVIYYLCGSRPQQAQEAVSTFSDYLRHNLESLSQQELIPFSRELDHIRTYLSLEQLRFGDELQVILDIHDDSFLLPVLSVQPLVENAVKHGIAKKRGGGVVKLASCVTPTGYRITVTDDGVGFHPDRYMDDGKRHIGLNNVRRLLRSRVNATLTVESAPGKGTCITVDIPRKEV